MCILKLCFFLFSYFLYILHFLVCLEIMYYVSLKILDCLHPGDGDSM
jgi:hypothetical protein